MKRIAGLATALVFTLGVAACGENAPQPRAGSSTSIDYVHQHSGNQRCTGINGEEYFFPPLTLQTVLNWSDFVVVGIVESQTPTHLRAIPSIPGTLDEFVVEKVLRTRGRIPVPKRIPWLSFSALDPSSATFNCADQDPPPIVGKRYLVFFYEVGGEYSAVRGSAATAALVIDDQQTLHSIASTLVDGKAVAFGASRELDLMTLERATDLLVGMTQGPDPLARVRAGTRPQTSPPITVKVPGAIHNPSLPPLVTQPTTGFPPTGPD